MKNHNTQLLILSNPFLFLKPHTYPIAWVGIAATMGRGEPPPSFSLHLALVAVAFLQTFSPINAFCQTLTRQKYVLHRAVLMHASVVECVEDAEAYMAAYLYPDRDAEARKSLAFQAQDTFFLEHEKHAAKDLVLTKKYTTYGEFPLASLHAILQTLDLGPKDVFLDLGSGSGRLVLGTALLFPYIKASVGIEVVPEMHAMATEAARRAVGIGDLPKMSPFHFVQGNAETGEYATKEQVNDGEEMRKNEEGAYKMHPLREATVIFMYCTTWRSQDGLYLAQPLQTSLLKNVRSDVTIITTDKCFADGWEGVEKGGEESEKEGRRGFRVVRRMAVPNPEVWESIAHIHEVMDSKDGGNGTESNER